MGPLLQAPFGVRWTVFHRHLRPFARHAHGGYGYFTPRHADTLRHVTTRHDNDSNKLAQRRFQYRPRPRDCQDETLPNDASHEVILLLTSEHACGVAVDTYGP